MTLSRKKLARNKVAKSKHLNDTKNKINTFRPTTDGLSDLPKTATRSGNEKESVSTSGGGELTLTSKLQCVAKNRKQKSERSKSNAACKFGGKKKKNSNKKDVSCLYCYGLYSQSVEGWIQFQERGKKWSHYSCAGASEKTKQYCCEMCA